MTLYNIDTPTILAAAVKRFGPDIKVSAPYWVDHEIVRVSIRHTDVDVRFAANFYYKTGIFP